MKHKISKSSVDQLRDTAKFTGKRIYMYDTDLIGFGAMATPNGSTSYFTEYRQNGRKRRKTIGRHGPLTPQQARIIAQGLLGDVARGIDITAKPKNVSTVGAVFSSYFKHHEKPTKHWRETKNCVDRDAARILDLDISTIKPADIAALIDTASQRSDTAALKLFVALRPFFRWATERGYVDRNPCSELRSPSLPKPRDRVLSDSELVQIWRAAEEEAYPFGPIVQLLILTGQRLNEVAGIRWKEIDGDVWSIPSSRTKNSRSHAIYLAKMAREIISRQPVVTELIFSTTGYSAPSGFGKAKRRIDAKLVDVPHWRLHDLRRTCASGMAALGIEPHIIERVLNHVSGVNGGLVSVYQRHEYRDERRHALDLWSTHISSLTE